MGAMRKTEYPLQRIRASEMPWEPLGTHGLRRRLLGLDAATGHVTSIVGIPENWRGGGVAHYHDAVEEVYIMEGSVTLDDVHYWKQGDYFYRPARIVHGHDEKSHIGAMALTRSDGVLVLNLVHEPAEPIEYPLPDANDPRGHVFSLPVADVAPKADPALPTGWGIKLLSHDPVSGARTFIAEIPAGWHGTAPALGADWEAFVLSGSIDGTAGDFVPEDYTSGEADTPLLGATASETGCTVLVWQFGRP
ncbi:MAG: cupin domain-containing protein [Pseudomonadota bacterium]